QSLVPPEMQEKYGAIPVRLDGRTLTVAMKNPKDLMALDDLRMRTGYQIRPVLASEAQIDHRLGGAQQIAVKSDIQSAIDAFSMAAEEAAAKRRGGKGGPTQTVGANVGADADLSGVGELVDEAPIIRIVNAIIQQAIQDGASDIHLEPQRRNLRVRYRIDGVLHEIMQVPQYIQAPLISRCKIMADMNIAERRIPQDGRIHVRMNKKTYDLRVSSIPTTNGEKIVMRILDTQSVMIGLEKLGLYPETEAQLRDLASQPNGMLLSSGPTGSGKTTTQYSLLNILNQPEVNIITIEDPVEYQLPGLSQVHVNRKAGLTFANALRSFLRQDPDIIMVGEMRDLETAEIAIQASLTGHLVLSTLHTNDAPTIVTRLIDMGVEPFLVAATLIGGLAQRLARRICTNCKEPYKPSREELMRFGFNPDEHPDVTFYHGRGCELCRHTGFKGRIGIFELMRMNEEIADLVVRRAPLSEIKAAARANGMKTLQEDGFQKCIDGLTTVKEVMRVVFTAGY
ncbi:MAG: GspE/PulE family protein, partial [Abditibacteriales bacterium]|nr:GspE/PulE family protein [Abditibacteriales bacterium]MDW8368485.1 GspE/PulE family protein [Abditibacteriales bacterium]